MYILIHEVHTQQIIIINNILSGHLANTIHNVSFVNNTKH